MTITTRPLIWDDLEWLRCLRNANAAYFFKTDEITPEQQLAWWVSHPEGDEHWVIVEVVKDGLAPGRDALRRCGYFAFVRPNPLLPIFATAPLKGHVKYLNSLLLEPSYRGQSIMPDAIRSRMRDGISYCGYVKEDNAASLRTCLKAGMKLMGLYQCEDYGRLHVLWRG
jgi:RimJ/RimL family protein N-acetyltransferase